MKDKQEFNFEEFINLKKKEIEYSGFIEEASSNEIINHVMRGYKREFVKHFFLEHIIPTGISPKNGDGFHLKWKKRFIPITEEDLDKLYLIEKTDELSKYRKSGMKDINGVEILEGSIINADGYDSDLKEGYFHCVEYYDGQFGSNVYGDFEPLSSYKKIEVVGHCTQYKHLLDIEDGWGGNLGAVIKD